MPPKKKKNLTPPTIKKAAAAGRLLRSSSTNKKASTSSKYDNSDDDTSNINSSTRGRNKTNNNDISRILSTLFSFTTPHTTATTKNKKKRKHRDDDSSSSSSTSSSSSSSDDSDIDDVAHTKKPKLWDSIPNEEKEKLERRVLDKQREKLAQEYLSSSIEERVTPKVDNNNSNKLSLPTGTVKKTSYKRKIKSSTSHTKQKNDMLVLQQSLSNKYQSLGVAGIVNLGNTCYLSSVIQTLFSIQQFIADLSEVVFNATNQDDVPVSRALVQLASDMDMLHGDDTVEVMNIEVAKRSAVDPSELRSRLDIAMGSNRFAHGQQQDAHECLTFIVDTITDELRLVQETNKQLASSRDNDNDPSSGEEVEEHRRVEGWLSNEEALTMIDEDKASLVTNKYFGIWFKVCGKCNDPDCDYKW